MTHRTRRASPGLLALLLAIGTPSALAVTATSAAAAGTCHVTNTSTNAGFSNLQTAIGKAKPGRTLRITGTCVGRFTVTKPLTLRSGAGAAVLKGNGATVLTTSGNPVMLIGLRITGGTASVCPREPDWVCGGGIANTGVLYLTDTSVSGNTATGGTTRSSLGGGIYNDEVGVLTLTRSTVSGNTATSGFNEADGAGIDNEGVLHLLQSTVSGNHATGASASYGGGIFDYLDTTLEIAASTISGNSADAPGNASGGGLDMETGAVTVTDSTITGNSVSGGGDRGRGGGIRAGSGTLTVIASTIADNQVTAPFGMGGGLYTDGTPLVASTIIAGNASDTGRDCTMNDPASSLGDNIIGSGASCLGFQNGVNDDQVGTNNAPVDPKLGPLADNGGPTRTRALKPGSPAIDSGAPTMCATRRDQRGVKRPKGNACDIGAFERG